MGRAEPSQLVSAPVLWFIWYPAQGESMLLDRHLSNMSDIDPGTV